MGSKRPAGDVHTTATITPATYEGMATSLITLTDPAAYYRLKADDPANAIVGAYVTAKGVDPGTNLLANGPIHTSNWHLLVLSQQARHGDGHQAD